MSKLDITTQDLLRRLGSTTQSRSVRADALFRKLRLDQQDQLAEALSRGARKVDTQSIPQGSASRQWINAPSTD